MFLQQPPIVVDVVKQPPVAEEITMADVIVGAFGLTGVIMLSALVVGAIVGAIFIWIKRTRDAAAPPADREHSSLRM
jgi:membrane protein CcdC involved in cytochrome C biogenesis